MQMYLIRKKRVKITSLLTNKQIFMRKMKPENLIKGKKLTKQEAWLFLFKYLQDLDEIPQEILDVADEGMLALIKRAEISNLSEEERAEYNKSLEKSNKKHE